MKSSSSIDPSRHRCGGFRCATEILQSRRSNLDRGVKLLLTREALTAEEFLAIRSVVAELAAKDVPAASRLRSTESPTFC